MTTGNDAVIIICSRIESRRLPNKALMEIEGLSAIEHMILRIKDSSIPIILAVPQGQAQEHYLRFLKAYPEHVQVFEGDPESPLHRMAQVIESLDPRPSYVIRATHDDILIDSHTMLDLLETCQNEDSGYGCSPGIIEGAGVEVIKAENLLAAANKREEPTEFVSYFVRGEGMPFPKITRIEPRSSIRRPYRLTIDYPEDVLAMKIILRELGAMARLESICQYLDSRPYILNINRQPDVTFYTCAKNMEKWIGDTMLSVLGTNTQNMEYIVVDDGSTDRTLSEIAKFSGDPRVNMVINDKNVGLASSSNIAVDLARGKVVIRVDADDLLIAGAFREDWPILKKWIESGYQVIYPGYSEIDEDGKVLFEERDPRTNYHAGCAIMERAFLNELRFKDNIRHWDGLELYRRIRDKARIEYVQRPLWQYRRRAGSMSQASHEREKVKQELGA